MDSYGAADGPMIPSKSVVEKRSISIAGHRTSISLEAPFWGALKELAAKRGRSVQALVAEIDKARGENNLPSAIRVVVPAPARLRVIRHVVERELQGWI